VRGCVKGLLWEGYSIPRYNLRPPSADGKLVLGTDDLLALLTFNLAYDTGVFPVEAHRIQLSSV